MTSGGETAAQTENRLGDASSPYLLQHADNPVAWRPWGDEAFREARERDVPVFVSIGYSTCHWCHVMARESFQDPEVAELLNRHFVAVKVDREERPDVDGVYMTACQMMTGGGGWPLSVFVTPDREPFFAGTYFPKESRGGRPGFVEILNRIAHLWENRREDLLEQAGKLTEGLKRAAGDTSAAGGDAAAGQTAGEGAAADSARADEREAAGRELDEAALEEAYRTLERRYDDLQGGFGSAPKFPAPQNLLFLLRHGHRTGRKRALEMVEGTLEGMRRGGVYDQVGFGFHRYSTDARWHLPHFEKMLYDQALLAYVYAEAGLATGRDDFARTAREVLTYVLRDLRDPEGGFHSAEDADSEGPDGEHGEGKFYVWTEAELREVLGEEDFLLAKDVWDTREAGNFAEEATGRRTGENVLHLRASIPELARSRGMEAAELEERLESIRRRLYEAREERPRPHLDDKVLTDWNGLAVAALVRAGTILDEEEFVEAGREAAEFVLGTLRDEEGTLLHRYRAGEAGVPAVADDYAFLIWGLLELHDATLEPRWLREALELQEELVRRLWDEEAGGFYFSGPEAGELPARQKSAHDGAMPSANGVAAWNAVRLARLTGQAELEERVLEVERTFGEGARRAPAAHVALLLATDFRLGEGKEVVLGGRRGTRLLEALLEVLREEFRPRTVVLFRPSDKDEPEVARLAPFTREMRPPEDGAAAWVCRDFVCRAPVTEPEALRRELAGRNGSR